MRQTLIHKQTHKKVSPKSQNDSVAPFHNRLLSLRALLFDPGITREDWETGLKAHSSTLTDLLLNKENKAFEKYLNEEFESLLLEKTAKDLYAQSDIANLNYKTLLQELLQTAVLIEHSTIPPYLTALYSIKDGTNALAAQIIRSVAVEEMLHMIMVCNVLNAVDIQPSVNQPENYPTYPAKLPLNVDFYVGLEKFSPISISTFISIESPSNSTVEAPRVPEHAIRLALFKSNLETETDSLWQLPNLESYIQKNVSTIGEYYDLVFFFIVVFQILGIYKSSGKFPTTFKEINQGGIFKGNPAKQIRSEQYYGSGGKLHAVENLEGVIEVFTEIKGQGEGSDCKIFDTDSSQFEEGFELAHYFRFKEILHEHFYIGGNYEPFTDENGMMPVSTPPVGQELPVDWSAVYPIRSNLKMEELKSNPALYTQATAFNLTYKRLLDAVQAAVEGRHEELEQSILIMYTLKEQATGLMRQPLTDQENAAPTFEYIVS